MLRLATVRQLARQAGALECALQLRPLASSSAQQASAPASDPFETELAEGPPEEEWSQGGRRPVAGLPTHRPATLDDYHRLLFQLGSRHRCAAEALSSVAAALQRAVHGGGRAVP